MFDLCTIEIPAGLLEAIRSFPLKREVEHCGARMTVSPFEFYAECPQCGSRIKVRSFSGIEEIEDVFDAVCEWMNRPMAQEVVRRRLKALAEDTDDQETDAEEMKVAGAVTITAPGQ